MDLSKLRGKENFLRRPAGVVMAYRYEYNVTLEQYDDDLWYYTVAQEINSRVEFLGWGYADTAAEASECISRFIREQFVEV